MRERSTETPSLDIFRMYPIYAYFPPKTNDKEHPDRVWVKRVIPCVWSFMKRRRNKEYVNLFSSKNVMFNFFTCPVSEKKQCKCFLVALNLSKAFLYEFSWITVKQSYIQKKIKSL